MNSLIIFASLVGRDNPQFSAAKLSPLPALSIGKPPLQPGSRASEANGATSAACKEHCEVKWESPPPPMIVALTHWPVSSWASGGHFEAKVSHELMPLKFVFWGQQL